MQSCFCVLIFVFAKHTKRQSDARDAPTDEAMNAPCPPQILLSPLKIPFPQSQNRKGGGNKIVVGTVVKAKIGELEEEVRRGSSRRMRKELTGVVQCLSDRRSFLVSFKMGAKRICP